MLVFFLCRSFPVESDYVFHKGHPFALDGVRNDGGWHTFAIAGRVEGGEDLAKVMTVYLDSVKTEGFPFRGDIKHIFDFFRLGIILETVDVCECHQIIQMIM